MIQLLYMVLFMEGAVTALLMMKVGPLRQIVMSALDQVKSGKGPAMVKTLACTMAVIMTSNVTSILKIQKRAAKIGTITPMDQILLKSHLLEASLMGFSLFLGLIIDRLHHQYQKLDGLSSEIEVLKKQTKGFKDDYVKLKEQKDGKNAPEVKLLRDELSSVKAKLNEMTLKSEAKNKEIQDAESTIKALQKQFEDLLLEYDRLLEDNQNFQTQLAAYE